jgi:hypothetical protein
MANDKKFIVKNGLLTPNNAVIGSSSDNGVDNLQVTGSSLLTGKVAITQTDRATPSLDVRNTGGYLIPSIVAQFRGDTDSLQIKNVGVGDYSLVNGGQENGIIFYDNTSGLRLVYNGGARLDINSTGNFFTGNTSIDGNRILTVADEGPGNGLDADTVDGLQADQFLRSDTDDTMTGNLTIVGNLTVSGTTTTVNTEIILLADNIITLNSNYEGNTPSENAGIEIERGSLTNALLQWNETNDYWEIAVGGVLGRIITTGDEGPGNGFDADTVDGLQAEQFLRSDVDDVANGNITILKDLTIGDNVGGAQIIFNGSNQDRAVYSDDGEIGFLNASFNWAARSDASSNWIVDNDIQAGQDVIADRDVLAKVDVEAWNDVNANNDVNALNDVNAGQNVVAANEVRGNEIFSTTNVNAGIDVIANNDVLAKVDVNAWNDINANNDVTAGGNVSATVDVTAGNDVIADNDVLAKVDVNAWNDVNANNDVTAGGDIVAGGNISAGGTVTANGDVIGARFVDADDNTYLVDPAGNSRVNDITLAGEIIHDGDTNTYIAFNAADSFRVTTGGGTRLTITNTDITAAVNVSGPDSYFNRYYDNGDPTYYGDFASTSRLNDISLVGEIIHDGDTNTYLEFHNPDEFRVVTGGAERLEVTNTFVLASNEMRAPIFRDSASTGYYGDFASTSVMNRIDIDDYIRHNGDTDTYMGFDAADNWGVWIAGTKRLAANTTQITATVPVYASAFYDSDNIAYFFDGSNTSTSLTTAGKILVGNVTDANRANDNTGTGGITIASTNSLAATQNPTIEISGANANYPLLSLNRIDVGNNPYANSNRYVQFYTDGTARSKLATDSQGNLYLILASGRQEGTWDSGGNGLLVVDEGGDVIIGDSSATYSVTDNTSVIAGRTIANNRLHVNGSIQLNGADDAIVFGTGTSSFLADEELAFGWGGGFYMNEATTVKVRNDKNLSSNGNFTAAAFYDSSDANYYVDPASTSRIRKTNLIASGSAWDDGLNLYSSDATNRWNLLVDNGAGDIFRVAYNNSEALQINTSRNVIALVDFRAPIFRDSADPTNYYVDPASTSVLQDLNVYSNQATGNLNVGRNANERIRLHITDSVGYLQYWQDETDTTNHSFNFEIISSSTGLNRFTFNRPVAITGGGGGMYASIYYDADDERYYLDPSANSLLRGNLSFGIPGNGTATNDEGRRGRWLSIEGNTDATGEGSSRIFFAEHNSTTADMSDYGMSLAYRGGDTSIVGADGNTWTGLTQIANGEWAIYGHDNNATGLWAMKGPRSAAYVQARLSFRAPIFEDSDNTAWYVNPLTTSRMNEIGLGAGNVLLRRPTGSYGSLEVDGGAVGGWEGFSIGGRMVFMHDNSNRVGVYNDVENEWIWYADRNDAMRLMYNGVEQARTDNGFFLATNEIRAPIFRDSNDPTNYYVNPNGSSIMNDLTLTTFTLGGYLQNRPVAGRWYQQTTYDYNPTDGVRYYYILIAQLATNSSKGFVEYYAKSDANYSHNFVGRIVLGTYAGSSMSVDHHAIGGPENGVNPEVYLDTSRQVWIRVTGNTWDSTFRWHWIQDDNITVYDGSTRQLTAPANLSAAIKPGYEIRFGSQTSVAGTPTTTRNYVGNLTAYGDVRAPIYYDSDTGTTYYGDFGSTSRINQLRVLGSEGIHAPRGMHGSYGTETTASSNWGATIWSIGTSWNGSGSGTTWSPGTYGLAWIRESHPNRDTLAGEGLYLYRASSTPYARLGRLRSRYTVTLESTVDVRAPIFYDTDDTNYYLDPTAGKSLRIAGGIAQQNLVGRPYAVWGAGGSSTGAVVIKFPGGSGNYGMIHAVIDIYEYSGNHAATVIIGGHNWNSAWYNYGANIIGQTDKPVRVGFKDGKYCIVIGNGSSGWSYGQVVLRKIQNGAYYNGVMDVAEGYTVGIESDSYTWISGDLRDLRTPSNFTAGGEVRGTLFRDTDNTGYYIDPFNSTTAIRTSGAWLADSANWSGDAGSGVGKLQYHSNRWYINAGSNSTEIARFRRGGSDVAWIQNSGNLVMRSSSPTVYFRDTDHNSAMLHTNSNIFYVLRGGTDSESWSTVNGYWPLELNLTNNDALFGGRVYIGADSKYFGMNSTANWGGDTGNGWGKLEYHSNRWYINAGANSTELVRFRRGGSNVAMIDNSGNARFASSGTPSYSVHGADLYADGGWLRVSGNQGVYWQTHDVRIYSVNSTYIYTRSNNGWIYQDRSGNNRGYVYFDGSSNFGLLNRSGSWRVRVDDSDVELYGNYQYGTTARFYRFEDRDDPLSWYVNPNGTSRLYEQRLAYRLHIGDETNLYDAVIQETRRPDLTIKGEYPQLNIMSSEVNNSNHGPTLRFTAYDSANASTGNFKHWVIGTPGTNATGLYFGYSQNQTNPHYGIGRGWSSGNNVSIFWMLNDRNVYAENDVRALRFVDRDSTGYYMDPSDQTLLWDLRLRGNFVRTYAHSGSDFTAGTLVTTSIPAGNQYGDSFVLEATGKSYSGDPPFMFTAQGYLYNNAIINYSGQHMGKPGFTQMYIFNLNGNLCFWWPRVSYWNSFAVHVRNANGDDRNQVTSITDSGLPGARTKTVVVNMKVTAVYNQNQNVGELYASRFIDSDSTFYYADPASTSRMVNIDFYGSSNHLNGNASYYYTSSGSLRGYIRATETDDSHFEFATSGGEDFIFRDGGFGGSWNMIIRGNGDVLTERYHYAQLYYDRNNTAYYVDPASTSQLSYVLADNWFRPQGCSGLYFQSYGRGLWAPECEGNSYGNVATYGGGRNGWQGWGIGSRHVFMSTGGDNVGVHDNSRGWIWYWNGSYTQWPYGYNYFAGDVRSWRFYDHDTSYYGDFNTYTNWQGLTERSKAQIGLSGQSRSSTQYYQQRPNITGDSNYWTGASGWGTVNMNTVADWGSGFFDSWSNPGNQPAGTSHWVGVQAYHYTNGSARYGWQMAGGPIAGLWFRQTWSSFGGWQKIMMYGQNEYASSVYGTIYYDANNPAYYMDPNSYSRLDVIDTNESYTYGWHRNRNSGQGLYNQSTGMHIYSTNGYVRMAGGGYSYGGILMFRNYESDLRGYCGYWDGSGFGMLNSSGNWQIRIEYGNANMELYRITYMNDARAYIYYDRANPSYYVDPDGFSRLAGSLHISVNNATGGGLILADDGDIVDMNDGWCQMRFSNGVQVTSGNRGGSWRHLLYSNGNLYSISSQRADIWYDYYNTGYYHYRGGTQMSAAYANNWFRPQGCVGFYFQSYGRGMWSPECEGNSYGNVTTYGGGRNGWQGWGIGSRHVFMSTGGDNVGVHDNSRGWIWYWNGGATYFDHGFTQFAGSARAPIFYDSNDTGYYIDPNGYDVNGIRTRRGWLSGPNEWGAYQRMGAMARVDGWGHVHTTNGNLHIDSRSGYSTFIEYYTGNQTSLPHRLNVGFMVDWNDNNYYIDMNGVSRFNVIYYWALYYNSDRNLKTNINTIESALDKVTNLRGVTFNWKSHYLDTLDGPKDDRLKYGFIAQEVKEVIPEAVTGEEGTMAIDNNAITPILVEAIKDLKAQVDALKAEIALLKGQ